MSTRLFGGGGSTVVTGASGFVGGELVRHLLTRTEGPIICPVRADSEAHAQRRGSERLAELFGTEADRFATRVTWLRADLEEPKLGWSQATWAAVAEACSEIFHCAASVTFDLPLEQAHRINVTGTQNIHQLAVASSRTHNNFRRFHHASTAYVAGRGNRKVQSDELRSDRARNYRNTYERTKARAERWLHSVASPQVPVTIHRLSIVAGNTVTGSTSCWNVIYPGMRLAARGMLPMLSRGGRELIDVVGVDFVVQAMVAFASLDKEIVETHHLTAGESVLTATQVIEATESIAAQHGMTPSQVRFVPYGQWVLLEHAATRLARLPRKFQVARKARVFARGLKMTSSFVPYTAVSTKFDASKDHAVLAPLGIGMPPGQVYLERITEYAILTDFGRHSSSEQNPRVKSRVLVGK